MGVLKFFRYITIHYPECLLHLKGERGNFDSCSSVPENISVDWLQLDLNSIYHPVAQKLYQYGNSSLSSSGVKGRKPLLSRRGNKSKNKASREEEEGKIPTLEDVPEETLFKAICDRLEAIRKIINPCKGIYFATDGTSGCSKAAQQRKRRFKGCLDQKGPRDEKKWDSNCISTGTLFMDRLSSYVDRWIKDKMLHCEEWKRLEIIVSNERVVGEGEHKCIKHMRSLQKTQDKEASHVVVSPDADLIFLTMGLHQKNIWIFRENIFDDIDASFFLVDVYKFRECILKELNVEISSIAEIDLKKKSREIKGDEGDEIKYELTKSETEGDGGCKSDEGEEEGDGDRGEGGEGGEIKNIERMIIDDFILYAFFIGNDFLPQVPSIDIGNGGIRTIFNIYSNRIIKNSDLKHRGISTFEKDEDEEMKDKNEKKEATKRKKFILNKEGLKELLLQLSIIEKDMIMNNYKHQKPTWPDPIISSSLISRAPPLEQDLDFSLYREIYYREKFGTVSIQDICFEYFKGLTFVLQYYLDEIPSYEWFYPFNYAPLFKDMYEYVDAFDSKFLFPESIPLSPLEQLVSVLPGRSAYLLPEPLRFLSTSENSPIIDMFPIDFNQDLDGKKYEYEGIILIPHIDVSRIREAFATVKMYLSDEDIERNKPGEPYVYRYKINNEGGYIEQGKFVLRIIE